MSVEAGHESEEQLQGAPCQGKVACGDGLQPESYSTSLNKQPAEWRVSEDGEQWAEECKDITIQYHQNTHRRRVEYEQIQHKNYSS